LATPPKCHNYRYSCADPHMPAGKQVPIKPLLSRIIARIAALSKQSSENRQSDDRPVPNVPGDGMGLQEDSQQIPPGGFNSCSYADPLNPWASTLSFLRQAGIPRPQDPTHHGRWIRSPRSGRRQALPGDDKANVVRRNSERSRIYLQT